MNKTAHIIVDFQNDFVDKKWNLSVQAASLWPVITNIMNSCKEQLIPNIATRDWHPDGHTSFASSRNEEPKYIDWSWSDHCIQHSWWAEIHASIPHYFDAMISKGQDLNTEQYSGFATWELQTYLNNQDIQDLIITWVATDFCVHATARDWIKLWYNVTIISDAIKAVHQEKWQELIEEMKNMGILFKTSESVLQTLQST